MNLKNLKFPYYSVYFKATHKSLNLTKTNENFHTIQSILKQSD